MPFSSKNVEMGPFLKASRNAQAERDSSCLHDSVLITFLVAVLKYSGKSNFRMEDFILAYSSKLQSGKVGKPQRQEPEAVGALHP